MKRVELDSVEFDAIVVGKSKFRNKTPLYDLLRMACYPLTKQEGEAKHRVQLWLEINNNIIDIIEQEQRGVSDITAVDIGLAKCYFLLCNHESEDYEYLIEDYGQDEIHSVKVKLSMFEFVTNG